MFVRQEHPEYNTQNITLQDVMARCQASRKGGAVEMDEGGHLLLLYLCILSLFCRWKWRVKKSLVFMASSDSRMFL